MYRIFYLIYILLFDFLIAKLGFWFLVFILSILHQETANGEKKSQLTYAFMLLTGQFVEKDEKLGNELLSGVLK